MTQQDEQDDKADGARCRMMVLTSGMLQGSEGSAEACEGWERSLQDQHQGQGEFE
jgi:hypothetical protein